MRIGKTTTAALVTAAAFLITGAAQAAGGVSSELSAERQLVGLLRDDFNVASYRRCHDERTHYQWTIWQIPADKVRSVRRTYEGRLVRVRRQQPRAICWRSHLWAESSAGRCVSSKEGGLRTNTGNGYYGKWQADVQFQRTYALWLYNRFGVASNWPEWAQDLMGFRGYRSRGWYPWPNTARRCGLL